jgi:hypothetical protein
MDVTQLLLDLVCIHIFCYYSKTCIWNLNIWFYTTPGS